MIICNSHNFIFLAVPRCASTSLSEFFVSNFCTAENDQWMPILSDIVKQKNVSDEIIKKYRPDYEYSHLTLQQAVDSKLITLEQATSMTKIVVLREPLARQLSLYCFFTKNNINHMAPKFFRREFKRGHHFLDYNNKKLQIDFPKLNGVIAPNTVFWNFNNLEAEIAAFCRDKPPIKYKLNKLNKSEFHAPNDYYDETTRQAVLTYYAEDVEAYANI